MIKEIRTIRLTVRLLERSIAFYEQLGFRLQSVRGRELGDPMTDSALLELPSSLQLELVQHKNPKDGRTFGSEMIPTIGSVYMCFEVADIYEVYFRLLSRGVIFRSPPVAINTSIYNGGYAVYFNDPDGYTMELFQTSSQAAKDLETSIYHIGFYISEIEKSMRFYTNLGFTVESFRSGFSEDYFRKIVCIPEAIVNVAILTAPSGPRLTLMEYVVPRSIQTDESKQDKVSVHLRILENHILGEKSLCDPDGFLLNLQCE